MLAYNARWVSLMTHSDPNYFKKLAVHQKPKILWVGCSDSRVPPTDVTGLLPGDIFVHRNVANLVHHADPNFLAVLQFAVENLQIPEIIVCGHYGCSGIRHAMSTNYMGMIDNWLKPIKLLQYRHRDELEAIPDPIEREKKLVELVVKQQVLNIATTPFVQQAWAKSGSDPLKDPSKLMPNVHGWIYDTNTGLIAEVPIDLSQLPESMFFQFEDINKSKKNDDKPPRAKRVERIEIIR